MRTKTPQPRNGFAYGTHISGHYGAQCTWIEDEMFCYPSGRPIRRAYCVCEDGKHRVIRCGIPDTYFSIPGYATIRGKRVKGYIAYHGLGGYQFHTIKGSAK